MNTKSKHTMIGVVLSIGFGTVGFASPLGYTITNLGDFGGDENDAKAVNRFGHVVGYSTAGAPSYEAHAWLWLPEAKFGLSAGMNDLGGVPNWDDNNIAWDVNSSSQVVGNSCVASSYCRAFLWLPEYSLGLAPGIHQLSPLPGDDFSYASGLNNAAEVVGTSSEYGLTPPDPTDSWLWLPHAHYGRSAGTHLIPLVLGFAQSGATDINGAGIVAVTQSTVEFGYEQHFRAYKWDPDTTNFTALPSAGGANTDSFAVAVNDAEIVVGDWEDDPITQYAQRRAALWEGTTITDVGSFGGTHSTAYGINKWTQVVGGSDDESETQRAFLWEDGTMSDLNDYLPAESEWTNLTVAHDISDPGYIVGRGETSEGERPFLMTPVCPYNNSFYTPLPDGTIDARQPHPVDDNSFSSRQGIGSPNSYTGGPEPIVVYLNSITGADNPECWELCETGIEQVETGTDPLNDNFVESVDEFSLGKYKVYLDRPISAGHWTTITYLGDGNEVSYASLPADANGDGLSHPVSYMLALINYINQVQTPPHGSYSTDIDHSGVTNAQDISRLTDQGQRTLNPLRHKGLRSSKAAFLGEF